MNLGRFGPRLHCSFNVCGAVLFLKLGEPGTGDTDLLINCFPCRIGNQASRVVGFDLVIHQRIDQELLTHVLKEIFLAPALEHTIGDNETMMSRRSPNAAGNDGGCGRNIRTLVRGRFDPRIPTQTAPSLHMPRLRGPQYRSGRKQRHVQRPPVRSLRFEMRHDR
jgi:hypothetical protein